MKTRNTLCFALLLLFLMGTCGAAVADDLAELRRKANEGDAVAQAQMGYYCKQGINGGAPDYEQTLFWWKKSSRQGFAVAQYNLAILYSEGIGVEQDYKQAMKWFIEAAKQQDRDAENMLGVMYERGLGMPADSQKAAAWYRRAAEHGAPVAQNNLGVLYLHGNGVQMDPIEAYAWLYTAAAGLQENAIKSRELVAEAMTAEDLAAGQKKGREYVRKYTDAGRKGSIRVSHILIAPTDSSQEALATAKAQATQLRRELVAGASFPEMAQAHSSCGSKEKGGDLGQISLGSMVPAFEAAAFLLEPGDVSGVVQTRYGFHIITRTE